MNDFLNDINFKSAENLLEIVGGTSVFNNNNSFRLDRPAQSSIFKVSLEDDRFANENNSAHVVHYKGLCCKSSDKKTVYKCCMRIYEKILVV